MREENKLPINKFGELEVYKTRKPRKFSRSMLSLVADKEFAEKHIEDLEEAIVIETATLKLAEQEVTKLQRSIDDKNNEIRELRNSLR